MGLFLRCSGAGLVSVDVGLQVADPEAEGLVDLSDLLTEDPHRADQALRPIELVAGVDFEEVFQANDQYDEEAQGATEFITMMIKYFGGLEEGVLQFTAAKVAMLCDEHRYGSWGCSADPAVPDPASLASALAEASGRPFAHGAVTAHRVARKLLSIERRPVMVDGVVVKLVVIKDHEGNRYRIERA